MQKEGAERRKIKLSTHQLRPGMYVSRLDRPWLETPFLFQGFRIRDEKQIARLQEYCEFVYVDVETSPKLGGTILARGFGAGEGEQKELVPKSRQVLYQDSIPVEKEITIAERVHEKAADLVKDIMNELRSGGNLQIPAVQSVINPMVDSLIRNPDAFLWLNELKKRDSYTYHRALNSSILAVLVGRHIGLPKSDLQLLALGCLLYDIGKTKIPEELLMKPSRLTPEEFAVVKRHVNLGVDLLRQTPGVDKQIIFLVRTHHERHDGSGYPVGLEGFQIPLFGRIAGLVDCYGAITTKRPYAEALSTTEAIRNIYEWRDIDFQAELVEQFIQALGVYPTGSLVELSTGEVAAVISQNRLRRLRPKVIVILDPEKRHYKRYIIVDMVKETKDRNGNSLDIAKGLPPGSYGINMEELYLS